MPLDPVPVPAQDIDLSVTIGRVQLGLPDLEINDGRYKVGPGSWGGQVSWKRTTADSAYVDGEITTRRTRQRVEEPLLVDVVGTSQATMETWTGDLLDALAQSVFVVRWVINGRESAYACEAADYQVKYEVARLVSYRGQVSATVPTQPRPLIGRY